MYSIIGLSALVIGVATPAIELLELIVEVTSMGNRPSERLLEQHLWVPYHQHQLPKPLGQWPSHQIWWRKLLGVFVKYFTKLLKLNITTFYEDFYVQWKIFYKFDNILPANKHLKMKKYVISTQLEWKITSKDLGNHVN